MKSNKWSFILFLTFFVSTIIAFSSCSHDDEGIDNGGTAQTGNSYGTLGENDITVTGDVKDITYLSATMLGSINNNILLGKDFRVYFLISKKYKTETDLIYENTYNGDSTRLEVKNLINNKIEHRCSCLNPNTEYFYRTCVKVGNQYYYGNVMKFITNDLSKALNVKITSIDELTPYSAKINYEDKSNSAAIKEIRKKGDICFVLSEDPEFGYESTIYHVDFPDNEKYVEISNLGSNKKYYCRLVYYLDKTRYTLSEGVFTTTADNGKREAGKAVDLGLTVKWADRNVGAFSAECTGAYFAFGETEAKDDYTLDNYRWPEGFIYTNYFDINFFIENNIVDRNNVLKPDFDAATVNWGKEWTIPTKEQFQELYEKCSIIRDQLKGVDGYKIIGPNGNSIFVPNSPHYKVNKSNVEHYYYWCANAEAYNVINLGFDPEEYFWDTYGFYFSYYMGLQIRPVKK